MAIEGQTDEELLSKAPFLSDKKTKSIINNEKKTKLPFIGKGYYFWDDDLSHAKWWGKQHYKGKYKILSCPMTLSGDLFLDVTGSVADAEEFRKKIFFAEKYLRENRQCLENWGMKYSNDIGLSTAVWLLQQISKSETHIFPYRIIRIPDIKSQNTIYKRFNKDINDKTIIKNVNIICFFDKNDINLQSLQIVTE